MPEICEPLKGTTAGVDMSEYEVWTAVFDHDPDHWPAESDGWGVDSRLMDFVWNHPMPPGARIGDLGCGSGANAIAVAKFRYAVTGFDCLDKRVTRAKRAAAAAESKAQFLCLDLVTGDLAAHGPFDLLYDVRCLEWITKQEDRARFLQNVRRALVPGGRYLSINEGRRDTQPEQGDGVVNGQAPGMEVPAAPATLDFPTRMQDLSSPLTEPAVTKPQPPRQGGVAIRERAQKRIQTPSGLRAELHAAGFPSCRVDYVYSTSVPPICHCLWALATP